MRCACPDGVAKVARRPSLTVAARGVLPKVVRRLRNKRSALRRKPIARRKGGVLRRLIRHSSGGVSTALAFRPKRRNAPRLLRSASPCTHNA